MGTEIYDGPMGELRAFTTAGGGTALTTTLGLLPLPKGTHWISLTPRNFATAVVCRYAKNPFLIVLDTRDNGGSFRDASDLVQDFTDSNTLDMGNFDTLANGDALYIGSHFQFRGVRVDGTLFNANASTLTVRYWNGDAWVDISATDGSAAAGAAFGQDGNVTWTVPDAWRKGQLSAMLNQPTTRSPRHSEGLYWTRWEVSAALDATVTVANLLSMNRSTAYSELVAGQAWQETVKWGLGGIGCIEALTDAGTASLVGLAAIRSEGGHF